MNRTLIVVVISFGLMDCRHPKPELPAMSEMASKAAESDSVTHDSLSTQRLKEIERIQHVFSEVMSSSLDEAINNFRRDPNAGKEIQVWSKMADAYERFAVNKHFEEQDKKEEAFQLILMRSMMSEGDALRKVPLKYLSEEEAKEIFSYYNEPPQPVNAPKK